MILYGQYDSPFVRRVGIALNHYGIAFERRVLSAFNDFDAMLAVNPLGRAPSLALDDGDVLFDSRAIIDYLDGIAPPARRLAPREEPHRRRVLRIEAVASGLAEKTYERSIEFSRRAPGKDDPAWTARLERQIASAARWLEALAPRPWFYGNDMSHADVAVAVASTYLWEKLPRLGGAERYPRLDEHRRRCESLPPFKAAPYSSAEAFASGWRLELSRSR